jgi:hypothetical protein
MKPGRRPWGKLLATDGMPWPRVSARLVGQGAGSGGDDAHGAACWRWAILAWRVEA